MSWDDKIEVQKGKLGEQIVDQYLKDNGIIPYIAVFDGPHPFDRLIASLDKKNIFIADIKTKARRNYYPDTGIDERQYKEYQYLTHKYNIRCFLFFVDESLGEIYGNFLDVLSQPEIVQYNGKTLQYPLIQGGIIYFSLARMKLIATINSQQVEALKRLSNRNYVYKEFYRLQEQIENES